MTYEIVYDEKAIETLEGLPKETRKRIFDKCSSAKENPHRFFKRLEGREDYRLKVGDYRVIANIDDNLRQVGVTLIDHRKRVYKRLGR